MNAEQYFTERRQGLHQALFVRNAGVASLYRSAVRELSRPAEPGEESSHVGLICHSMREFMSSLPGVVSEEVREREDDAGQLARQLPKMAARYPDMNLELDQRDVPVPQEIARQIKLIIVAQREVSKRIQANERLLLTGNAGLHSPEVTSWHRQYRYFQEYAHWDRGRRTRPLPSDDQLDAVIATVDDLMQPRVQPFLEGRPAVEELLRRANGEGSARA